MKVKTIRVIKTQKELDEVSKWEEGKYYLVIGGRFFAPYEDTPYVNKLEGDEFIKQYNKKISNIITSLTLTGEEKNLEEFLESVSNNYLVPWRYH